MIVSVSLASPLVAVHVYTAPSCNDSDIRVRVEEFTIFVIPLVHLICGAGLPSAVQLTVRSELGQYDIARGAILVTLTSAIMETSTKALVK